MEPTKGDHGTCEVVKVKHDIVAGNDTGYVEINKADFDSKKHELFEDEEADTATNWNSKTKAQIITALEDANVKHDPDVNKAALVAIAEEHLK